MKRHRTKSSPRATFSGHTTELRIRECVKGFNRRSFDLNFSYAGFVREAQMGRFAKSKASVEAKLIHSLR